MKAVKILFVIATTLFVMSFSCGGSKEAQKNNKTAQTTEDKTKVPADFEFSLQETGCRGTCPIYKVFVNAKGEVYFQGQRNVKFIGEWKAQLSKEKLLQLYNLLEQANLFQYKDEYDNKGVADLPSTYLYYKRNGKSKKIHLRYDVPPELNELTKTLFNIFHNQELNYKKISDATHN